MKADFTADEKLGTLIAAVGIKKSSIQKQKKNGENKKYGYVPILQKICGTQCSLLPLLR